MSGVGLKIIVFACAAAVSAQGAAAGKVVRASTFGYDPLNGTKCLQAALDSGAETVVIDADCGEWCLETVYPRSNQTIVFGKGVTVRAVPGAFKNIYAMMFRSAHVTNVTIRGEAGANVSMLKPDYLDDKQYKWSEWRHLFAFYDCGNIALSNLAFSASGGDGVYVARCQNVRIENVLAEGHNRQGISVIGAENLYVGHSRFSCTAGTPPACGIDFEPNKATECFVSNVIEDCDFDFNESCGVCFHIPHFVPMTRPVDVTIRNCRFVGNKAWGFRMFCSWADPGVAGRISVENCLFAANRDGVCSIGGMPHDSLKIAFRDCIFDNRGNASPAIVFDNGESPFDFGGVTFENTRLYADNANVFQFHGYTGDGVTNVQGTVDVCLKSGEVRHLSMEKVMAKYRPDPAARAFKPATVYRETLEPVAPEAKVSPTPVYCRGRQFFVQAAPTPGERRIRFLFRQRAANPDRPEVTIHDKVGTLIGKMKLEKDETEYVLKTTVPDNTHLFTVNARGNLCAVVSDAPGHGVLADSRMQPSGPCRLYFTVPAKSKQFKAEMLIRNGTSLTARIVDAAGKVRASVEKENAGRILTVDRTPTEACEVWHLEVVETKKPFELRFGGGVTAVLSDSPEACLRAR